jgi:hypothetical protein
MTDGILLAEIQRDRMLRRYDTLIIDEAHERSLNIDFLLGYLKQLLPRRPDLKVIITSATIDPERFAEHFVADAPIVEVSGRTYPVEVRYRPWSRRPGRRRARGRADRDQVRRSRRGRRAAAPRARRHPGLPLRRAGDPRHRRRAQPRSATCATPRSCRCTRGCRRRAAPGLPAAHRPPGRAGHQRRRDLADRARHQVRDRPRHRADLPLQPPAPRCSGCRSSRSRRPAPTSARAAAAGPRRHLHPAVLRGGLRGPARVHRPGDPAHQPGLASSCR